MQESLYDIDPAGPEPKGLGILAAKVLRWAGSLLSLGLVLGIVFWTYSLGKRDATEVPVIRALEGAARIAPEDPGGAEADHQGLEVNEVLASDDPSEVNTDTSLAPAPQNVSEEDGVNENASTADPVVVDAATRLEEIDTIEPLVAEDGMTIPVFRPKDFSAGDPLSDAIENLLEELPLEEGDTSLDTPAIERPTPQFGNAFLNPGDVLVQLGAFNSVVEAGDAWMEFRILHADLLNGLNRYIQPIETGGRLLYQLQASGLSDLDETNALCAKFDERGIDCISVTAE